MGGGSGKPKRPVRDASGNTVPGPKGGILMEEFDPAQEAEAERKQQIGATTDRINKIYDAPERQAQYGDFVNAVRDKYLGDANKQKVIADRETKFATARSGLTGGSREVDSKRQLGEEYTQGILQAENKAQSALGDLKAQDNSSRMNLIQLAQSGLDASTAASRAMANTKAGTAGALADSTMQGLGDVFAGSAAVYRKQQDAAALRAGRTAPLGSLYGKQ